MNRPEFILSSIAMMTFPITTLAKVRVPLRFGIVTDSHYADYDEASNRYYRQSLSKMRECVDLMNEQKVEFLISLGDLVDGSRHPSERDALRFLDDIEREFARFDGPRYHVLGNHDMDALTKPQVLGRIKNTGLNLVF